jgi:hypothetical protein
MGAPKKPIIQDHLIAIYITRDEKQRIQKKLRADGFRSISECGRLLFLEYLSEGWKRGKSAMEILQVSQ